MKICLAGTACSREIVLNNMPPYILESFYYFRDWQKELVEKSELFLLDSGAFTFMNNFKGTVIWKDYVDRYAQFVKDNNIKYFFELDIDALIGYEQVKELTRYLEKQVGRKCIPVWHKGRGKDEFLRICKEYDYIAIGGIVTKEIKPNEYKYFKSLIDIAHKHNCKIHGLGFTNLKNLKILKFDSVDSTSWLSGSRFGQLNIYSNGRLKSVSYKNKRIKDYKLADKFNLNEWLKFVKYADKNL